MQKGINTIIKEVRESLVAQLNSANLPIAILSMIVREVSAEVMASYEQTIKQEQEAYDAGVLQEAEAAATQEVK